MLVTIGQIFGRTNLENFQSYLNEGFRSLFYFEVLALLPQKHMKQLGFEQFNILMITLLFYNF